MHLGRLRRASGFSIKCSYEFIADSDGRLVVGTALYNALSANEEATLILADGSERLICISLTPSVGMATFRVLGRSLH